MGRVVRKEIRVMGIEEDYVGFVDSCSDFVFIFIRGVLANF